MAAEQNGGICFLHGRPLHTGGVSAASGALNKKVRKPSNRNRFREAAVTLAEGGSAYLLGIFRGKRLLTNGSETPSKNAEEEVDFVLWNRTMRSPKRTPQTYGDPSYGLLPNNRNI